MLPFRPPRPALGEQREFLMLVKTYPIPSAGHGETVCCAGIDAATHRWVRMYPVNFRSLEQYRRFKKWQFIRAEFAPNPNESRPESVKVQQDTIRAGRFIEARRGWSERRTWMDPLVDRSLEQLKIEQRDSRKSLGLIRPRSIDAFMIRPAESWDPASRADLEQLTLAWATQFTPARTWRCCRSTSSTGSPATTKHARVATR